MTVSGPVFLAIYAVVAIAANLWLRALYRSREEATMSHRLQLANDPYRIAVLRDGHEEAIRVAVLTLINRGLLEVQGERIAVARADANEFVRHPLDRALIDCFRNPAPMRIAYGSSAAQAACRSYEQELQNKALLAGAEVQGARFVPFVAALGVTLGIAGARIAYALSQGRSNIGFLVVLALICAALLALAYNDLLTALGKSTLNGLKRLYQATARRLHRPETDSFDVSLAAAVFGVSSLPRIAFPALDVIAPKPKPKLKKYEFDDRRWTACSSCGSGDSGGGDGGGCGGCGD